MRIPSVIVAALILVAASPARADQAKDGPETWLLATYYHEENQRMSDDTGVGAVLQDQRAGDLPLLLESQSVAGEVPIPRELQGKLVLFKGRMVEREVETRVYVSEQEGVKPTKTEKKMVAYRFFLAASHEVLGEPALVWENEGQSLVLTFPTDKLPGAVRVAACLTMDNADGTIRFAQPLALKPGAPAKTAWIAGGTMPSSLRILVTNVPCDLATGAPALGAVPTPAVSIRLDRVPDRTK